MDVKLIMFKSNGQRKDFPITGQKVIFGRAEDCDLRVPLLSVSRHHCQMTLTDEDIKVEDMGSSNGTYVNNERVTEQTVVSAGDRLVIGPIMFTVQIDGQPDEIQPVKTKGQKMAEEGMGAEEVVDLDAEVVAQGAAEDPLTALADAEIQLDPEPEVDQEPQADKSEDTDAAPAVVPEIDVADPISALEALASESDEEEKE